MSEKVKHNVFKFLHNPNAKWSHLYHSLVMSAFCTASILLNLHHSFEEYTQYYFNNNHTTKETKQQLFQRQLNQSELAEVRLIANDNSRHFYDHFSIGTDSMFAIFLIIEFSLRIWSSTYIKVYREHLFLGFWIYYRNYFFRRSLDLIGIFFYLFYIICHQFECNPTFLLSIRTTHQLQIFQSNRILFPYFQVICRTIFGYQRIYVAFLLFSIFFIVTMSSVVVYLTENYLPGNGDTNINCIFSAFWHIYITFSTIGYGDLVPVSFVSRTLFFFLTLVGSFWFSLPASMIGTSLSIKIGQDYRKSLKFRQAVRLIQTIWRCRLFDSSFTNSSSPGVTTGHHHPASYIIRRTFTPNRDSVCSFHQSPAQTNQKQWHETDYLCLLFIYRVRYVMSRYRFNRQLNMPSVSDISQQDAELWQRIDYIENDLATMSAVIDSSLKGKIERLRAVVDRIQQEVDELSPEKQPQQEQQQQQQPQ